MFDTDLTALDADMTLSELAAARALAERAEVRVMEAATHWADLHGVVDTTVQDRVALPGTERLVLLGGEGTPEVSEFATTELGAVLALSAASADRLVAAALDLRHRLPRLWSRVLAGEVKPWMARRVAEVCRDQPASVAAAVDRKTAPWADRVSMGRLEAIVTAAVLAADPAAAAERARRAAAETGVWLQPSTDAGIKHISILAEAPDAIWFDASLDRVADSLGRFGDARSKDARRAAAIGVLARPQLALDLFDQTAAAVAGEPDDWSGDAESSPAPYPSRRPGGLDSRPPVTLYVHLTDDTLRTGTGVARLEGVGPVLVDQIRRWLGHTNVTVRPVLDLAGQTPVDAYEIPDRLRDAIHLRSPVDVFPYATNASRRRDLDHTIAYVAPDDGGPPGQTRADNLGPMTRRHHRAKTHGRWRVSQPFDGVFVWRSPHGRHFLVDHTGTQPSTLAS